MYNHYMRNGKIVKKLVLDECSIM